MFNFKIGGGDIRRVKNIKDLENINGDCYILGGGTNILCDKPTKPIYKIEIRNFEIIGDHIIIGAGNNLKKTARKIIKKGYSTLLSVSGIPGTVGGGVVMNCGASHGDISDEIVSVTCFDINKNKIVVFPKKDCEFSFRNSLFKKNRNLIVVEVCFNTKKGANSKKIYKEIQQYRKTNYPLMFPSAGCVFRGNWGGRDLIKAKGFSGMWHGGAVVSPFLPAFILNANNATFDDVMYLINQIQQATGLKTEIEIWK